LKKFIFALLCAFLISSGSVFAQENHKGDLALGFGSLLSTSSAQASGNYAPQSMGGGLFTTFSADFLLRHNVGVAGELSWRDGRNLYEGYEPFRPLFYDINGVYSPRFGKHLGAEVMAGIGAASTRFYSGQYNCNFVTCTDYVSTTHFMGHIGGGVKLYVHGNFFIRPEVHWYLIHNNNEFSSGSAERAGVSIGYTF
jgi:outer membrane protein W